MPTGRSQPHRAPTRHQSRHRGQSTPGYTADILKVPAHLNPYWNRWIRKTQLSRYRIIRKDLDTPLSEARAWHPPLPVGCVQRPCGQQCVPYAADGNRPGRREGNFHGECECQNLGQMIKTKWAQVSYTAGMYLLLRGMKKATAALWVLPKIPKFWPTVRKTSDTFQ